MLKKNQTEMMLKIIQLAKCKAQWKASQRIVWKTEYGAERKDRGIKSCN